jgi:hypothetical protein
MNQVRLVGARESAKKRRPDRRPQPGRQFRNKNVVEEEGAASMKQLLARGLRARKHPVISRK